MDRASESITNAQANGSVHRCLPCSSEIDATCSPVGQNATPMLARHPATMQRERESAIARPGRDEPIYNSAGSISSTRQLHRRSALSPYIQGGGSEAVTAKSSISSNLRNRSPCRDQGECLRNPNTASISPPKACIACRESCHAIMRDGSGRRLCDVLIQHEGLTTTTTV